MRIRSTKPEFWRSETIAELDWDTRLILKGIEAYVDDNGVGKDSVILICADVFPHDLARDPETVARVSRGLEALCTAQILVRYTMAGERLLYVRRWKSLQRVDKPNKGRHPRPDGTLEYIETVDETVGAGQVDPIPVDPWDSGDYRETLANGSGDSRETPAPGTEEQGNRGTGEKETSSSAKPPTEERRDDVEALCVRLRDHIVANGSRATISGKWRTEARLLIDRDGRELDKALRLIDWCQSDSFWKANVLSMRTFRAKYDQLRLKALDEHEQRKAAPSVNGSHLTARETEFIKAELMKDNPNPEVLRQAGIELPGTHLTALPGGRK